MSLSPKETLLAIVIAGYMLIQILVPLKEMTNRHLTQFGWKMFAMAVEKVEFRIIYRDGTVEALPAILKRQKIGRILRVDVDRPRFVPPHLCAQFPNAAAIEFSRNQNSTWEQYECS
jgi:hypothetical protein